MQENACCNGDLHCNATTNKPIYLSIWVDDVPLVSDVYVIKDKNHMRASYQLLRWATVNIDLNFCVPIHHIMGIPHLSRLNFILIKTPAGNICR